MMTEASISPPIPLNITSDQTMLTIGQQLTTVMTYRMIGSGFIMVMTQNKTKLFLTQDSETEKLLNTKKTRITSFLNISDSTSETPKELPTDGMET